MNRLYDETLHEFANAPGLCVIMFGAPNGRPSMAQAEIMAQTWADRPDIRFGHIDALTNENATRLFRIRTLPTTLVFLEGALVAHLGGFQNRSRLEGAFPSLQAIAA